MSCQSCTQVEKKDPFQLGYDIQLGILEHVNEEDLSSLLAASPALRDAYRHEGAKSYVARERTKRTLTGDLLQDALAVVHFPEFGVDDVKCNAETGIQPDQIGLEDFVFPVPAERRMNRRGHETDRHLRRWAAREFADPFRTRGCSQSRRHATIRSLCKLCETVQSYAKDYIAKAMWPWLPAAYHALPLWATASMREDSCLLDRSSYSQLAQQQQERIAKAFLQYELLCKVYRPAGDRSPDGNRVIPKPWKMDTHGPFRSWDWELLAKYRREPMTRENKEMLASVREYVACSYGALFYRWQSGNPPGPGLLGSSRAAADHAPYLGGDGFFDGRPVPGPGNPPNLSQVWSSFGWSSLPVSMLATCGLGVLHNLLLCDGDRFFRFLREFTLNDTPRNRHRPEPTSTQGRVVHTDHAHWHPGSSVRRNRQRANAFFGKPGDLPHPHPQISPYDDVDVREAMFGVLRVLLRPCDLNGVFTRNASRLDCPMEAIFHGAHRSFTSLGDFMTDVWSVRQESEEEQGE